MNEHPHLSVSEIKLEPPEVKVEPPDETESQPYVYLDRDDVPFSLGSLSHQHSFPQQGSTAEAVQVKNETFQTEAAELSEFKFESNEGFSGGKWTESFESNVNGDCDMTTEKLPVSSLIKAESDKRCDDIMTGMNQGTQMKSELFEPLVHSCDVKQASQSEGRDDQLSRSIEDPAWVVIPLLSGDKGDKSLCTSSRSLTQACWVTHDDSSVELPGVDNSKKMDPQNVHQNQSSCSNHSDPKSLETMQTGDKPLSFSSSDESWKATKFFMCDVCDKMFACYAYFRRHLKEMHPDYKPFKCDVCDKGFFFRYNLAKHKKSHCAILKCDVCYKTFSYISELDKHRRVHTREINKCDICDKIFLRRFQLNAHKNVHTGEKPFQCGDVCGKTFPNASALYGHKSVHPKETSSLKCDFCSKMFSHTSALTRHKKTVHGLSSHKRKTT